MTEQQLTLEKALPKFETPSSLDEARLNILNLGRNMAEHAYLIGCNLIWVKSQLKHGEFRLWIEKNVWYHLHSDIEHLLFKPLSTRRQ